MSAWVTCSARLPGLNVQVLAWSRKEGPFVVRLVDHGTDGTDLSWDDESEVGFELEELTHWMPLPEPPR